MAVCFSSQILTYQRRLCFFWLLSKAHLVALINSFYIFDVWLETPFTWWFIVVNLRNYLLSDLFILLNGWYLGTKLQFIFFLEGLRKVMIDRSIFFGSLFLINIWNEEIILFIPLLLINLTNNLLLLCLLSLHLSNLSIKMTNQHIPNSNWWPIRLQFKNSFDIHMW